MHLGRHFIKHVIIFHSFRQLIFGVVRSIVEMSVGLCLEERLSSRDEVFLVK